MKGKNRPLEQIYNRITEKNRNPNVTHNAEKIGILNKANSQVNLEKFAIALRPGNNTCKIKSGETVKITEFFCINESVHCSALLYKRQKPLYRVPENSNLVGIEVATLSQHKVTFPLSSITNKCVALPYRSMRAIFPLLHGD